MNLFLIDERTSFDSQASVDKKLIKWLPIFQKFLIHFFQNKDLPEIKLTKDDGI